MLQNDRKVALSPSHQRRRGRRLGSSQTDLEAATSRSVRGCSVLDGNNSENPPFLFSCKSGAFATTAICSSKIHTCHVLNFKPGFVVVANAPLLHLFEKHPETGIHLGSKFEAPPPAPEDRRARGPPAALKHHDDRLGQAHCTATTTARPSDKLTARQRKYLVL